MPKKIDTTKKSLRFNKRKKVADTRTTLYDPKDAEADSKWDSKETTPLSKEKGKNRPLVIFFVFSSLFLLTAIISIFLFDGGTTISRDKITINIQGPSIVDSSSVTPIGIRITNDNPTPIAFSDIQVIYPEGTRDANGDLLLNEREIIGEMGPGETALHSINPVLYGTSGEQKKIEVNFNYRFEQSNAEFVLKKEYTVVVQSSLIAVNVVAINETVSGERIPITIEIQSNAVSPIENVLLSIEYPFGFSFKNSSTPPRLGNTVWDLGTLEPSQQKRVIITGDLSGQNNEERTFRITTGIADETNRNRIASVTTKDNHTIRITRPFIEVQLTLNDSATDPFITSPGESIRGNIWWANNTDDIIRDAKITLKFDGKDLDQYSTSVDDGFFDDKEGTIYWSSETYPEFETVEAGSRGRFLFSFKSSVPLAGEATANRSIPLSLSIEGQRFEGTRGRQQIEKSLTRMIKIRSLVDILATTSYSSEDFKNIGPLPPRRGETTTYTISLLLKNNGNRLRDSRLSLSLPSYVQFENVSIPRSEGAVWDESRRILTWPLENVEPQVTGGERKLSFQVSITPTISQIGTTPVLVNGPVFEAFDIFVGEPVRIVLSPLTTELRQEEGGRRIGNVVE